MLLTWCFNHPQLAGGEQGRHRPGWHIDGEGRCGSPPRTSSSENNRYYHWCISCEEIFYMWSVAPGGGGNESKGCQPTVDMSNLWQGRRRFGWWRPHLSGMRFVPWMVPPSMSREEVSAKGKDVDLWELPHSCSYVRCNCSAFISLSGNNLYR